MADKEERIEITYFNDNPCKDCDAKEECKFFKIECGLKTDYKKGITKQKAIEVMAKRLEYDGVNKFECHTIAKWCLDELLKGVKK